MVRKSRVKTAKKISRTDGKKLRIIFPLSTKEPIGDI